MIQIEKKGSKVRLSIDTGLTDSSTQCYLYWDCGNSKVFAELLTDKLITNLENRIVEIRKEEYERGWKDAKAKRAKRTWWSSLLKKYY